MRCRFITTKAVYDVCFATLLNGRYAVTYFGSTDRDNGGTHQWQGGKVEKTTEFVNVDEVVSITPLT